MEGKYIVVYGLMRAAEKDVLLVSKVRSELPALRALSAEHADALAEALKAYGTCQSCRGARKVACTMCKGQGEVEIVCPHCNGTGKIKLKDLGNSDTIRGRQAGSGAQVRTPSGEIVSVGSDETICPTCIYQARKKKTQCSFCQGAKTVECQRCKWQKFTLASVAGTEPCRNCEGTGFAFKRVAHPCVFCRGLGLFLIPVNAPSARIGPAE